MALKHWHPGKLVLFWVLCIAGGTACVGIAIAVFEGEQAVLWAVYETERRALDTAPTRVEILSPWRDSTPLNRELPAVRPPTESYWQARWAYEGMSMPVESAVLALVGVALLLTPFVVTWKWFTVREKRDQ